MQTSIVQGADGLGQYLKKILSKPILLVTGNGREFYPERIPVAESIRKILCHMPSFQDEQYYYIHHDERLPHFLESLPQEELRLFLFISRTAAEDIDELVQKVRPARLALAYFLRSQIDLGNEIQRAIEGYTADAFSGIQYRIENLLRRNGIHLDESQAYRVMLVEFEDRSVSEMEVDFKGSLAQLAHRYTRCPSSAP